MRKELLNGYLGVMVSITLFDGSTHMGKLGFTSKFCEQQGWRHPNMYYIGDVSFYPSHIKSLKTI